MIALIVAASIMLDEPTPDPNSTVVLDGIRVTIAHVHDLFVAYQASKSSNAIDITFQSKPAASMPWYDPHWHYAGSHVDASSVFNATVWLNQNDAKGDAAAKHVILVGMASGVVLAVMESGFAGSFWKDFYNTEAARDVKAAKAGDNPYVHRDTVAAQLAVALVGK